ncbi:ribonuclease R [Facklamia sp. DSM 111018]|uniref:Ribonuclease R n=1 Tax=Facklamia lactis TaxID=2749967 RepID=A0ABS0LR96_9LACT|nr:ribonuclease R [Facklamia lactis]MBG9980964.1 ribonuclease R [Facklamia lactis]MBG9986673.1 ribonuclease R [Facklamia lactis]
MSLSKLEREVLHFLQENKDQSFKVDQIAHRFNYKGSKNYKRLVKALAFLERVGEIQLTSEGQFKALTESLEITGIYRANDKGYGFISHQEGESDLFVPRGKNGGALDGDTVIARIIKQVDANTGKGSEAQVVAIQERKANQLVGEFYAYNQNERETSGYLGYVKPQGEFSDLVKIFIRPDGIHPADHTICIVKISEYPTNKSPNEMVGIVAKEIGHKDAPGVDILAILFQFGIPHEFPEQVIAEAENIGQTINPDDMKGRVDLRNELIITIDGADAKDLDDAISLTKVSDREYHLGVHIADVSHYVKEGSAIDQEAYERGTSVYLTDRVVPMLPQRLSNGICSLHPHEDRLTLSCEMVIDGKGQVVKHEIFKSVIHSSYRMTYSDVNAILEGNEELREKYQEITPMLDEMAELHEVLYQMRKGRGALDFDAPEAQVLVDESGHPTDIVLRERFTGERLIESFMLAANETVAETYLQRDFPFIYRIHEQPDEAKMDRFAEFITSFGIVLRGQTAEIDPKQLQEALKSVKGEPYEQVVSTMMLRSMQQAKYSENPAGHFGLAAEDYTHFTSPIRRYPDLMVHRLISNYLEKSLSQKERSRWEEKLPAIANHSSQMERRAVEAERETDALKKAEYMEDKIGEIFEGTIASVTSFGIFVALPNTVEGLVSLQSLTDDYYQYNPQHMMLIGERTRKVYRIGQKVKVQLLGVDIAEREIDFAILDAEPIEDVDLNAIKVQTKNSEKTNNRGRKEKGRAPRMRDAAKGKFTISKRKNKKNRNRQSGKQNRGKGMR